jgi:putative chitinase
MDLYEKYKTLFNAYHVNTPLRIANFMAQIEHESGLKPISENFNYSATGLSTTFKKYFPTPALANAYQRQPEKIANKVYANRMGNGNEASGQGFLFRGRGFLQITGKNNYLMLSKDARIDCFQNPDILLEEANAMIATLWFWGKNKLNDLADLDNIEAVTKKINGGFNGLAERKKLLIKWKSTLNIK